MKSKSTIQQWEPLKPSSTPWLPLAYMKRAVKFLLEHAAGALFLDPGLGKTSITLAALKLLIQRKLVTKVLIIAPLRVCHLVWPAELQKWTDFHGLRMVVLHGPNKEELLKAKADIYVINPEGLEWLLDVTKTKTPTGKIRVHVNFKRWKQLGFDTLVVDELTKFKHSNSVRFKAMKEVLHTFGRRWGLTGSPAANGLLDLFGQCYVLDQGRTLGQYISHYRMEYFLPSYDGFSWTLKEGADEKIYKRLKPLALRMAAEDYLTMPQVIENPIWVSLPEPVRKIYDQLEHDLLTKIDDEIVTASTSGAASMKCRQVANGGVYLDQDVTALVKLPKSKREWVDLHDEKVDVVEDLLEELQGSPLLVAYEFRHDLTRLQKRFDAPYIGAGVSTKETAKLEARWNDGKLPLLLAQPVSIGHGLNLQGSCYHVCWHSMTYDYEVYDQFIRRVRRRGQRSRQVFVHHVMAADTVDEAILMALKSKYRGQEALFRALKSYRSRR